MLRVGLTGGIGAGKSTVAGRLAELGALVVDADLLAREVVAPGTDGLAEVHREFGDDVLQADGSLDRAALGTRVFADPQARARLEAITHPRIAARTAELLEVAERTLGPAGVAVHDVPLLVERQLGAAYHLVVVVHAPVEVRVQRLTTGRGMTEQEARSRIAAQADDDQRRAAADVWLDNVGTPEAVRGAVDLLWRARMLPYAHNLAARRPAVGGGHGLDDATRARLAARVRHALTAAGRPGLDVVWTDGALLVPTLADDVTAAALLRAGFAPSEGVGGFAGCDPDRPGTRLSVVPPTV